MFLLKNSVYLYGRNVIADILLPTSFKQEVRSTPYGNIAGMIKYRIGKNKVTLSFIVKNVNEFDADKKKPMHNEYREGDEAAELGYEKKDLAEFDPAVDTYSNMDYYRRLEDFDVGYIQHYIENTIFTLRKTTFEHQNDVNGTQIALPNFDGDGFCFPADLEPMFKNDAVSPEERRHYAQEMLFHMKRLHLWGIHMGVHTLTFITAYLKSINTLEYEKANRHLHNRSLTRGVKLSDLYDVGIYHCDAYGDFNPLQYTATQKAPVCKEMFDWITHGSKKYESYYIDYSEMLDEAEALHVNLAHEDLSKFDHVFFGSLMVNMVTPEKQYLPTMANKLRLNVSAEDTGTPISEKILKRFAVLSNTDMDFVVPNLMNCQTGTGAKDFDNDLNALIDTYNNYGKRFSFPAIDASKITWINNIAYIGEEMVLMDAEMFYYRETTEPKWCILTKAKVIISLSDYAPMLMFGFTCATLAIVHRYNGEMTLYKSNIKDWQKL